MWWPSFVAVLKDLWVFTVGGTSHSSSTALNPGFTAREPLLIEKTTNSTAAVSLAVGVTYDVDHSVTKQIRLYLGSYDQHLVGVGVLTTKEWLTYTLLHQKSLVPALALYMTPIGNWHKTLSGQGGTAVGVMPRTNALIEWRESVEKSLVGLVVSVTPAETIKVGMLTTEGVYTHTVLERSEWIELRPVFSTV